MTHDCVESRSTEGHWHGIWITSRQWTCQEETDAELDTVRGNFRRELYQFTNVTYPRCT
jgi:hypothetical protein